MWVSNLHKEVCFKDSGWWQLIGQVSDHMKKKIPVIKIQGDPKEVIIVILLWRIEKCINRTMKFFYSRIHIERFDYLSFFYFEPKKWPLKNMQLFFEINGKWLFIQGFKNNLLSHTKRIFLPFFYRPQQTNWGNILKSVLKVG